MSDLGWPLRRAEALFGDRVAFGLGYRELAARLSTLDLDPGARIGVLAANSRAHAEAWLGVPAAGGVIVSLNYRLAPQELRFIVEDAQLSALITDAEHHDLAGSLGCPLREWEDLLSGPPRAPLDHDPDTLGAISYTGGTTGTPKGRDAVARQPARQRAAQPRRHRPPPRPALAARVPDVPRRRHRQPARVHLGGRGAGRAPALRRRGRAGDDRARAHHPHRPRADDARDAARRAGRRRRGPLLAAAPAVRGVADLGRAPAARSRSPAGVRRRPVLRDDRGGADRHAPVRGGPPPRRRAPALRGHAGAGRGGRGPRVRRAVAPRPERHARLLEPPGRDGGRAGRRLVPLGRRRPRRRARLPLHRRPREGHDHHGRRERLLARGRLPAPEAPPRVALHDRPGSRFRRRRSACARPAERRAADPDRPRLGDRETDPGAQQLRRAVTGRHPGRGARPGSLPSLAQPPHGPRPGDGVAASDGAAGTVLRPARADPVRRLGRVGSIGFGFDVG